MKQRQVIKFKSTSEFNVDNVDFGLAIKNFLFLCHNAWEIVIFILTFKEITVFQCHNYGILSTLKQRQNFMLEQRWFWLDTKTNFVLLYQQTQNVESMSKLRRHVCNYETWHSYTLPKEDQINIKITRHTSWILLTSAFFHRKSTNFAMSRNTDIDCILIHNF